MGGSAIRISILAALLLVPGAAAAQQQVTGTVLGVLLGVDTVIIDGTIVAADFSVGAVDTDALLDGSITTADLGLGSVTADILADLSVDTAALQDGSVTTAKLADGAVTTAKIAANAVTATELADDAVDTSALQDGSVTAAKIADGAVTSAALADGSIGFADLAPEVQGRITGLEHEVDALSGGVAMAIAMANAPVVQGGRFSLSLGTGLYQDAVAGALKAGVMPTDNLSLTGSVAYTSKGALAVGGGIGVAW